ncbi:MAG: isoleucine--tRNA ligase [Myxococcales bacterium]|nr:isoleucine--tRNA ligase [Deltaproteobacteria bacterium]NND28405.1 isoleucine--tRNA ligase [Myxococcales bacterium]RZV51107.1 MAG: isoleucine--tRNA ligase [Deltaproteobacteria bacterium]
MFDPVSPQVSFPEIDAAQLAFWEKTRIFEKTLEGGAEKQPFIFYEGPPTANGMPHPGHVLTRVMKDVFLRYRTMCGYYVPRRAGWDTHGLPVEVEVEKELGISGREAIQEFGVEAFSRKCIDSVFKYIGEWQKMTERIGFWVDFDSAYVTFHKSYVESVWWALSEMFKQGLLYQGYKVVWWWPQGGTALSAGEVGQGYRTIDDPSVMVRFPVVGEERTSFLAWTTTPWTLPSNIALAVSAKTDYATVELEDGERLVLAAALVEKALGEGIKVVETRKGSELVGMRYEPPFRYAEPEGGPAWQVIDADFVSLDSGSGLVHLAPAFGEDDFRVCKEKGMGFLQLMKPDGTFPDEVTDFAGRFCKDADRDIIRNLRTRGVLFKEEVYRHDYPFCWRAMDDPLIQYARRSWFIRTTQEIERVKENNQAVHWEPEHIKSGRMGQFLEGNVDWALSRERFWGTPLPIWKNDETGAVESVGSVAEILERNPNAFAHFEKAKAADPTLQDHLMVHKPWIDSVSWTKDGEPGVYRRVPEVIDCWFDSGCMPFAQWGFPHQNADGFEGAFPADFITEAVDQTRGWFYSLMTISSLMFPERAHPHPFQNCVVLGLMTDEKGKKLSKRDKNYTDPLVLMDRVGADAVRWALYAGTVPGQSTRFFDDAATDAVREFLLKIWNVYSFFVTYANIDRWTAAAARPALTDRPDMDRWVLAELDATVRAVRQELDDYKSHMAVRHLLGFIDGLSNWYVRRSRARFWASDDSDDKRAAFSTLYEVLVDLAKLAAPFVPFMTETLFQNLVHKDDPSTPVSVHLASFPEPDPARIDEELRKTVGRVRNVVTLGQRVRNENKLKVRQPLAEAIIVVADDDERRGIDRFASAIREELNVRALGFTQEPHKYVEFELVPNFRVLGPKLGKQVPACKKALADADGSALYAEMEANEKIVVQLPNGPIELTASDVEVRLSARDDFAAASGSGQVVVLDTRVDDSLRREGMAREVINRIQRARKTMDLPYEARIEVEWNAEGELAEAVEEHAARIARETLASGFVRAAEASGEHDTEIDGNPLTLSIDAA